MDVQLPLFDRLGQTERVSGYTSLRTLLDSEPLYLEDTEYNG